jgi:hypothetical protein
MDSRSKHHPAARYADWIAGLLVLVILADLALIVYRKYQSASPEISRKNVDFKFRFDPNIATVEELEYLPGLSRKLAEEIVAYREDIKCHFPDRIVFQKRQDLTRVKGISDKTLSQAGEFLLFPDEPEPPVSPKDEP